MSTDIHTLAVKGGSTINRVDRVSAGFKFNVSNNSSAGPIASVAVTNPGNYITAPSAIGLTGNGSGAVLAFTIKVVANSIIQAQSSTGSYAPTDTVTLAGGTFTTAAVLTVTNTMVNSATVAAGGSGGTNGTQTVAGTTGTGTKFQASVTVASGAITAVLSITVPGNYTVNPTTLTAEPVTGAGLTGATLNIKMGVLTASITTAGSYTVLPTNPVSQGSTSGSGTGATFSINWGIAAITVPTPGMGYDNTSAVVFTGGNPFTDAVTAITLNNTGNAVTVPITFVDSLPSYALPKNLGYGVYPGAGQACSIYCPPNSKTTSGFNVVLTPLSTGVIAPGSFDVSVFS